MKQPKFTVKQQEALKFDTRTGSMCCIQTRIRHVVAHMASVLLSLTPTCDLRAAGSIGCTNEDSGAVRVHRDATHIFTVRPTSLIMLVINFP